LETGRLRFFALAILSTSYEEEPMSEGRPKAGTIGWHDLTVDDADDVRAFYEAVVGWTSSGLDMGGYEDFVMSVPGTGDAVGGVCHARGPNANLPPVWLIYVNVDDLDASVGRVRELGGDVISGPKEMGGQGRYCVVRDPAGAAIALFEPPK